jgi:hypothetical protein
MLFFVSTEIESPASLTIKITLSSQQAFAATIRISIINSSLSVRINLFLLFTIETISQTVLRANASKLFVSKVCSKPDNTRTFSKLSTVRVKKQTNFFA